MKYSNLYSTYLFFVIFFILLLLFYFYKVKFFNYSGIYNKNILPTDEFEELFQICSKYNETNMVNDPKANGRLMHIIPVQDPIYKLLFKPDFIQKIKNLCGNMKLTPCLEVPIEYRKYKIGSNMEWHRDVQMLSNQLQYECVITLENTSDSKTIMKNWFGLLTSEISTEPNSLIIVRAHGVEHCVTTTRQGKRTILKFVFCEEP